MTKNPPNVDNWKCNNCTSNSKDLTLGDILKKLRLMRTEQSELIRSVNLCHDKIGALARQETAVKEYLQKTETLEAKNSTFEKEDFTLRQKIKDVEQYSKLNLVEIYGVPEPPNEEILNSIHAIGSALDFKIVKKKIRSTLVIDCRKITPNQVITEELSNSSFG
ncbi:hypothetical protein ILUMI_25835 [Ignelater luminosus]|uniref:Uncharacterized protein n=1 Tax=Ignelater luminosus TaxID=2038154 RepID=A0A8K0C7N2_IGNLU|nr:hypothetical protein ILUMI_25835 [Ignelater luminosus]